MAFTECTYFICVVGRVASLHYPDDTAIVPLASHVWVDPVGEPRRDVNLGWQIAVSACMRG